MNDERLFAVNLLWVHDPDMFAEYQEQSKPVLAKHGVHIERWPHDRDDGRERV